MKILLFHPWLKSYGGGERLVYEYSRRSRHDIDIYTWYLDPERTWFKLGEVNTISSGRKSIFRMYLARGLATLAFSAAGLPHSDYDLTLISSSGLAELTLLPRTPSTPVVTYSHTILRAAYGPDVLWNITYRFRGLKRTIYRIGAVFYSMFERFAWQRVNFAVFNSELSRARALDKNLVSVERTSIVYPGVNLEGFSSRDPADYFLYVGRFSPLKRQHVLLRAFYRFAKKHQEYKLYLAGSVEDRGYVDRLYALIRRLGLESSVTILTNLSDSEIRSLYSRALALIHIPFMEDFGIVPFEAAASGRFIINVKPSGNFEILRNFPGVFWIDDPFYDHILENRVYSALDFFASNEDELVERGKENLKAIRQVDLSWTRFAKELDSIVEQIVSDS